MLRAEIQCITEDSHNELILNLKNRMIKHSYHIVDGWGLYSIFHLSGVRTDEPIEITKETNNTKVTFIELPKDTI